MSQELPLELEESSSDSCFFLLREGGNEHLAKIVWRDAGDGVIDVHHTFTDPSLRGQGIARKLVEAVAAYASERELRIKASCSYAYSVLSKSDAHRDLLV